jgi:LPS-assembly protein
LSGPDRIHQDLAWEYCGPRPARLGPVRLPPPPGDDEEVAIGADDFTYEQSTGLLKLTGGVVLDQGSRGVRGERMTYNLDTDEVVAEGEVLFASPGVRIAGSKAEVNLETDRGRIENPHYRLTGPANIRGEADQAELVDDKRTRYRNITYSTCPPGREDWSLKAETLELDQGSGVGVARHATLRVGSTPVLYTPYVSFPIDSRRKSGFLVPTVGTSGETGFDLTVPYYWNIAPQMDATFFPRIMTKRGLMLGGEFRFLTERQEGELYGEIVPYDPDYRDGTTRGALRLDHKGRYAKRWSSSIDFNLVSDERYLEDFGNSIEITSVRNIQRRGDLAYRGDGWRLLTRLQDFQTVDSTLQPEDRPYGRLPQLLLKINQRNLGPAEVGMTGEYNYFDHSAKVHGHRVSVQPYASWPVRRPYGHLIPSATLYHSSYRLEDQDEGDPEDPSYTIPSFNMDGKLVFERTIDWLGQTSLQTLEPRLFYLYTRREDQDDIPVFDSSELTFSFSSLFRANRFTGRDRIGDANQLTLGLTSRTLANASGYELFRASIGQILYFEDREVQISGPPEDQGTSAFAGELATRFSRNLSGRATFQWDPQRQGEQWEKRALQLHYETPENRLVNLAYRFDQGSSEATRFEDTDLSLRWPVSPQIGLVGRWFYSLLHNETTEAFAGIEYGQCCWRLRLLGRHLKNKPDAAGNNSVMLQLELAGLGALGNPIDKFLEREIYGYHSE